MYELVAGGHYVAREPSDSDADEQVELTPLASGGFLFSWVSGTALRGYLIDANGSAVGSMFNLNEPGGFGVNSPSIAGLPSGGFVASWVDGSTKVLVRTFDSTGAPTSSSVALDNPLGVSQPSAASLSDGSFVVAFKIGSDGDSSGIRAQRFDSSGNKVGAEFSVNSVTASSQIYPQTIALDSGGFLISWHDDSNGSVAGQFYDASGNPVGGQVTLASGNAGVFDITTLASGDFVIVWRNATDELRGQIYEADGTKVGAEFAVNDPTAGVEYLPAVAALASGGFAVTWQSPTEGAVNFFDNGDIHAQIFDANGAAVGDEIVVASGELGQSEPQIVSFGSDDLFITYVEYDEFGNSTIMYRALYSAVQGTEGPDVLTGGADPDFIYGNGGDDQISGLDGDDNLYGGDGNDTLDGGAGANWLEGGAGNDALTLGTGTDPYAWHSIAYGGIGADSITGTDGRDEIYSDVGEDYDIGYSSFNPHFAEYYHLPTLDRGTEVDTISAGGGVDFVSIGYGDSADGGAHGEHGDELFLSLIASPTGLSVDFQNTTLVIGGGTITGFEHVHYVEGSQFSDTFIFSPLPFPIEDFGGSSGGGREISGLGGDDQITAGYYTNNIWGGDGNDYLDGRPSQYLMYLDGGAGNDTLLGGAYLVGGAGDDTLTGGTRMYGDDGNDTLIGNVGSNILNGGEGADSLQGGAGDDTYEIDAFDTFSENSGEGTDTISIAASYILGANFENLTITGTDAADGTGNEQANVITGNSGANVLIGLGGNDTIWGNEGNDVFIGGEGDDYFNGGAGSDTATYTSAMSGITLNLGLQGAWQDTGGAGTDRVISIENLIGSAFNDTLTGGSGANVLEGGTGNDTLNGGAGNDTLNGGGHSDTASYAGSSAGVSVDLAIAVAQNTIAAGTDTLMSIENLLGSSFADTLRGDSASNTLDGGNGDDRLFGNAGNDSLRGGAGYDRMYGGIGNDTYYANDADDYAYENEGEGTDRVIASIDHQLRANVENLILTGAAVIGKGNELANIITGSSGANKLYGYGGDDQLTAGNGDDYLFGAEGNDVLNGGAGYDRMYGGVGNDVYIVADGTDYAYENAGEGTDRVVASINHTLRANIEELELGGSADLRGYGNAENNLILGNSGNNLLYGRDGNDTLEGGDGNDILWGENGNDILDGGAGQDRFYGGAGADDFVFDDGDFAGTGSSTADRIHDFSQAQGDQLRLSAVDANTVLGGDQAFAFIGTGAFTGAAGQLRYQQISGNTYVQGDVDGDGTADFWIRLDGLHTLNAGDFLM